MSRAARWAAVGVATALGIGLVAERRVARTRRAAAADADAMGALHGDVHLVRASDGLGIHAEVDEVAPYAETQVRSGTAEPTMIFVHGYALNLDCWHFQRAHLRGKRRMVFYDQRSHGRSERSAADNAKIDQLGLDLKAVIEQLVPDGPVVVVGHSMGGMSIIALADLHPEMFGDKIVGVGLISTTAGEMSTHRTLGWILPDPVAGMVKERGLAALTRAPQLVDVARRRGSNLGYLLTDAFAFGTEVPAAYVEFTDAMLSATPFEVLAEFFPEFDALDKFQALETLSAARVLVACGTKDRLTPISHSRKLASHIQGSSLLELVGAGHMVMLEKKDDLNAALDELLAKSLEEAAK